MTFKLFFFSLTILISAQLYGQDSWNLFTSISEPQKSKVIVYSPYLFEEFRETKIVLLSNEIIRGKYKYNMEFELLENADGDSTVRWNYVRSFTFLASDQQEEVTFSNIKLVWPKSEYGGFIQDIQSSEYIKVKHYLVFLPRDYDPSTEIGSHNDRIEKTEARYWKVNFEWRELPDLRGTFYNLFGDMSDGLRKVVKQNGWKYKRVEDIGKMLTWIEQNRNRPE